MKNSRQKLAAKKGRISCLPLIWVSSIPSSQPSTYKRMSNSNNIKRRGCELDGNWGGTGRIAGEDKKGINHVNTVLI